MSAAKKQDRTKRKEIEAKILATGDDYFGAKRTAARAKDDTSNRIKYEKERQQSIREDALNGLHEASWRRITPAQWAAGLLRIRAWSAKRLDMEAANDQIYEPAPLQQGLFGTRG